VVGLVWWVGWGGGWGGGVVGGGGGLLVCVGGFLGVVGWGGFANSSRARKDQGEWALEKTGGRKPAKTGRYVVNTSGKNERCGSGKKTRSTGADRRNLRWRGDGGPKFAG